MMRTPTDDDGDGGFVFHNESDKWFFNSPGSGGKGTAAAEETTEVVIDITHLLEQSQVQAARHLGIAPSTLSKRFSAACPGRKWPYRAVQKLEKEIQALKKSAADDPYFEEDLNRLIAKRDHLLRPAHIRIA
mmetsp:Transcript_8095/g.34063  ORF Transcript_8095/g.34063 Transcript_8095/m.34063 type:complete len:132 (+) Transcript_8095:19-414(+)